MKKLIVLLPIGICLAAVIGIGCRKQAPVVEKNPPMAGQQQSADNIDSVLPGRHLSEHQVADIATKALPPNTAFSCEYKDGIWNILEPQKGVWGVSSMTTNADGKIFITTTNATQMVLQLWDADETWVNQKPP